MTFKHLSSHLSEFPEYKNDQGSLLPEVAIVGRSNVGKSTLINHLFQTDLAKVSSSPGKTRLLHFYHTGTYCVVDLPGYGYAKVSRSLKRHWSQSIDQYLNDRPQLQLILQLLDIRRVPTKEDIAFFNWTLFHQIPVFFVYTKTDKVSSKALKNHIEQIEKELIQTDCLSTPLSLPYSLKSSTPRKQLLGEIAKHFTKREVYGTH